MRKSLFNILWIVILSVSMGVPTRAQVQNDISTLTMPISLSDLQQITTENVGELVELADLHYYTEAGVTVRPELLVFSPDSTILAVSSENGINRENIVQLWAVATGSLITTIGSHSLTISDLAFDLSGLEIATASSGVGGDQSVRLWDVATNTQINALENVLGGQVGLQNDHIIAVTWTNQWQHVQVWDLYTGEELSSWDIPFPLGEYLWTSRVLNDDATLIALLARTADGHVSPEIDIVDVANGNIVQTLQNADQPYSDLAFSPNNQFLLGSSLDTARIWSLETGQFVDLSGGYFYDSTFTADSQMITARGDNDMLFDTETGRQSTLLSDNNIFTPGHTFSPDMKLLASRWANNTANWVRLYGIPRCAVRASRDVNMRDGAGANFDAVEVLPAEALGYVDGQTSGNDGLTWWHLTNGLYVREDTVDELGTDCAGVTEM